MSKHKKSELELIEARLTLELKRHTGEAPKAKDIPQRPPRHFIVVRLSCKKPNPASAPMIVTAEVETISELQARVEAARMARSLGFNEKECIELDLNHIEK